MILSIIVPVYNVEKYLARCLESILNQSTDIEYEIVVINDGSTDSSASILREYKIKYPEIKLIEQENKGLSIARNIGFAHALGKYVWFVDSDDTIDSDAVEKIYSILSTGYDYDAYVFNIQHIQEKTNVSNIPRNKEQLYRSYDSPFLYIIHKGMTTPIQRYILKKSFIINNSLSFYPQIYHEDQDLVFRLYLCCQTLKVVDDKLYNYLIRENNSITSSFSEKRIDSIYVIIDHIKGIINDPMINIDYKNYLIYHINIYHIYMIKMLFDCRDDDILNRNLQKVKSSLRQNFYKGLKQMYRFCELKQFIILFIANFDIFLIYKILKIRWVKK